MLGEKADRRSAPPISSATEWQRFLKISRRIGSKVERMWLSSRENQVCVSVHAAAPTGRENRGAAVFGDDGGAAKGVSGAEFFAQVDWRSLLPAAKHNFAMDGNRFAAFGAVRTLGRPIQFWSCTDE